MVNQTFVCRAFHVPVILARLQPHPRLRGQQVRLPYSTWAQVINEKRTENKQDLWVWSQKFVWFWGYFSECTCFFNNFQPDIENLRLFFSLIDFFPVSLPVSLQRQLVAVWSKKSQIHDKEEPGLYSPKPLTSSKWTPTIQIVHSNVNTSP